MLSTFEHSWAAVDFAPVINQALASLFQLAPFVLLGGSTYLSVFKLEQLQALALLFLNLNTEAYSIELVFFGLFNLLIGYLLVKSTFLPRILGALMGLSGLGWVTLLSPPLANHYSCRIRTDLMVVTLVTGVETAMPLHWRPVR